MSVVTLTLGQDGIVSIPTHYGQDSSEIKSRWGLKFSACIQTGPGTHQPPAQEVPVLFLWNKAAGTWH